MNRIMRRMSAALLSLCIIMSMTQINAYASTKTISDITIKVNHNMEAGEYLQDMSINVGSSDGGDINVYTSSSKYGISSAVLTTSSNRQLDIGEEVKLKVTIVTTDDDYKFKGTYSSSNISVSGGSYTSSSRKSEDEIVVTLKLKPVGGTYEAPDDVEWKDTDSTSSSSIGRARWEHPDYTSEYYDIYLYRGGNIIKKVEDYKGTSYNFYPYMTEKGTYKFKVRTVPHTDKQKKDGKKSEWEESDEFYLDEKHTSDGSGADSDGGSSSNNAEAGWVKSGNIWYYKYPDGSTKKNGWELIGGKWYLFSSSGAMLTGWQTTSGGTYFINGDGSMAVGWHKEDNKWYYLDADAKSANQGAVMKNTWLNATDGRKYYMDSKGVMCEGWTQIGNEWYYFYEGSGYMATNTTIDTFNVGADGIWRR